MFVKAVRKQIHARIALVGPAGSGKTHTALLLAKGLAHTGPICVIDTERRRASLLADVIDFDVAEVSDHRVQTYVDLIDEAASDRYAVLVIDSLSHAWFGEGGILDFVDARAEGSRSKNTFAAWKEGTPEQRKLVESILSFPGHVVVTLRTKTKYEVESGEDGKMKPKRIGTTPVQREGLEYEFDLVGEMDSGTMRVTKSRYVSRDGDMIHHPGAEYGAAIREWLDGGAVDPEMLRPTDDEVTAAIASWSTMTDAEIGSSSKALLARMRRNRMPNRRVIEALQAEKVARNAKTSSGAVSALSVDPASAGPE